MSPMTGQTAITVFRDELTDLDPSRFKILVPVANPATADDLLDLATSLARERKGEIIALHVVTSNNGYPADDERRSASARRTILEEVVIGRRRTTVPIHTVTRIAASSAKGILDTASEDGYNLILLGWQGRIRPASLGSSLGEVLDRVVKEAPCPVAVVKNPTATRCSRILVPTAGGPNAVMSLEMGLTLARRHKAQVTALHIAKKGQEELGHRIITRAVQQVKTSIPIQEKVVVADHVVKSILKEARDYDVVILGASHEGLFQQILFGVIPEQVAKRCSKTVIMVKGSPGPIVTGLRRLWATWASHKDSLVAFNWLRK